MRDHVVIALGDGYGPTDNLEITVDTAASITFADPNTTTVEGAQDTPWYFNFKASAQFKLNILNDVLYKFLTITSAMF